jgi:hypothetical protein
MVDFGVALDEHAVGPNLSIRINTQMVQPTADVRVHCSGPRALATHRAGRQMMKPTGGSGRARQTSRAIPNARFNHLAVIANRLVGFGMGPRQYPSGALLQSRQSDQEPASNPTRNRRATSTSMGTDCDAWQWLRHCGSVGHAAQALLPDGEQIPIYRASLNGQRKTELHQTRPRDFRSPVS